MILPFIPTAKCELRGPLKTIQVLIRDTAMWYMEGSQKSQHENGGLRQRSEQSKDSHKLVLPDVFGNHSIPKSLDPA
jgi:hypothetical protein